MEKEQLDYAYLAGAMEGDGSFYITKRSGKYLRYVAGAAIGKSGKELAGFFVSCFSGNTSVYGEHSRWSISSSQRMIPFLECIIPYLVMKRERAVFLLNWLKDGMPNKEECFQEMKLLNLECVKNIDEADSSLLDEDPIKWAYIAGLMDTDGSFMISKRFGHNGMKSPNYIPKISYGEKDSRTPSFIKHTFSNGVIAIKDNDKVVNGRFVWELVVKEDICEFIRRVLPYLKVKKTNAEILLNFCENFKAVRKGHRFGVPKEELEFREKCYQDLKVLQRRGKKCDLYKPSLIEVEG